IAVFLLRLDQIGLVDPVSDCSKNDPRPQSHGLVDPSQTAENDCRPQSRGLVLQISAMTKNKPPTSRTLDPEMGSEKFLKPIQI
ncbi:2655_t:CDS:2, partial [Paraglomus occultum]